MDIGSWKNLDWMPRLQLITRDRRLNKLRDEKESGLVEKSYVVSNGDIQWRWITFDSDGELKRDWVSVRDLGISSENRLGIGKQGDKDGQKTTKEF